MSNLNQAIEFAQAAVSEYLYEDRSEDEGVIGKASELRNRIADFILADRGIRPSETEIDAICYEIVYDFPEAGDKCRMVRDGEALSSVPAAFFDCRQLDRANEELEGTGLSWIPLAELEKLEAEQKAKDAAEAKAERDETRWWLEKDEKQALAAFAKENGRLWKSKLRDAWMNGQVEGKLLWLRNARCFGPAGLEKIKTKELAHV